jgi:hypothetical protein
MIRNEALGGRIHSAASLSNMDRIVVAGLAPPAAMAQSRACGR